MWKYQSNKYNSYVGIRKMLETNRELYENNKLVSELVGEFNRRVDEIIELENEIINNPEVITKDKKAQKRAMAERASAIAAAGAWYASDDGDAKLLSRMNISFTKIMYAKDADALRTSRKIESILRDHVGNMGDYMVTGKDLDELRIEIDKFDELFKLRVYAKKTSVAVKKMLPKRFRELDHFLNEKVDRAMQRMSLDHPDFTDHYFVARQIVDLKKKSNK